MLQHPQLINLPAEIWFEISSFVPIQDLANSHLFLLSKPFFHFFLDDKQQQNNNHIQPEEFNPILDDHQIIRKEGGLFYKILCFGLMRESLSKTIRRILDRRLYMYRVGDFDEERNMHCYSVQDMFVPNYNADITEEDDDILDETNDIEMEMHYPFSRLNVEPCGRSMAKLRKQLKRWVEFSFNYFPHMHEELKGEIDAALQKSIKVCTHINKLSNGQSISKLVSDIYDRKPAKPKIWDLEKRSKSIEIRKRKLKSKVQWKILWKNRLREFQLDELKYYQDKLRVQIMVINSTKVGVKKVNIEDLLDTIERILEIIPQPGSNIFKEYIQKNCSRKANINFIESIVTSLAKCVKYNQFYITREDIGEKNFERVVTALDQCFSMYEEHFKTLKLIFPDTSIYHYLVRLENSELLERYLTPTAMLLIQEAVSLHNSFLISFLNYFDEPTESIGNFLHSLTFTDEINICNEIINILFIQSQYNLRKWCQLLIELFGMEKLLDLFNDDNLTDFSHLPESYQKVIKELFGTEFEEKYNQVMDQHAQIAEYMGQLCHNDDEQDEHDW